MNNRDNNIAQTYRPATSADESSQAIVVFITSGVGPRALSKHLITAGVPQGAIGYEDPYTYGSKAGALFVKSAYAEIVDQICKKYGAVSELFNTDFEEAKYYGLLNYLKNGPSTKTSLFNEYNRFKRAMEKIELFDEYDRLKRAMKKAELHVALMDQVGK